MPRVPVLAVAGAAIVLTACARAQPPASSSSPTDQRYEANAMVLQGPDAPAMLCLGDIAASRPPQCGTMPITNWDWNLVDGEEQAAGVTWGDYHVVGTYDGTSFTILETGPPEHLPPDAGNRFDTPCPEPQGGWAARDPGKATEDDLHAAVTLAAGFPSSSGSWITILRQTPGEDWGGPDDVVLNLAFTGDPEAHRQQIEEVWGGPLCLIEHRAHTEAELLAIQQELSDRGPDFAIEVLYSWTDVVNERVVVGVVLATAESRAALDARFGPGTVMLESALQAIA